MPSWEELSHYLQHGSPCERLREDLALEHLHRTTTRSPTPAALAILAFDHRAQLEELAQRHGVGTDRIARFKLLVALAAEQGYAQERSLQHDSGADFPAAGIIVDDRYGTSVLERSTGRSLWIGRPVERPGSRPLAFEAGANVGLTLRHWPQEHVVKCLLALHPDDPAELATAQLASVKALASACAQTGHEMLVELIPPRHLPCDDETVARGIAQIYAAGVRPDWWKLAPPSAAGWSALTACITQHDPHCRGVLLLGLEASEAQLLEGFSAAAGQPLCKGFAVGRTLFAEPAQAWFAGALDDAGVIAEVATRYQRLIRVWQQAAQTSPAHHAREASSPTQPTEAR
jgi:5-dehydro-2-deoxygluconokinase